MLQGSDVLTILAEIFVAFAGFTGIVTALGHRSEGKWRPVDVIRFRALLEASLPDVDYLVVDRPYQNGISTHLNYRPCSAAHPFDFTRPL